MPDEGDEDEDRPRGGDASIGNDHLAHGEEQRGVLYGWPSPETASKGRMN